MDISLEHIILSSNALTGDQEPTDVHVDPELERVSLTFKSALPAGSKATLSLSFKGTLSSNSAGYYKSVWRTGDRAVNYALTQFEVHILLVFKTSVLNQ